MKNNRYNRGVPENASSTHKQFYEILKSVNPTHNLYCEYPCIKLLEQSKEMDAWFLKPRIQDLSIDIYDSTMYIAFEIQGQQHDKYIKFFHGDEGGLDRQRDNDRYKKILCNILGIKLVYIPVDEQIEPKTVLSYYCSSK